MRTLLDARAMPAIQYSGYSSCFRLGLLLLLQLEGLSSSRNLFNKSVQLALVAVPREVGFGEFQCGGRLLVDEIAPNGLCVDLASNQGPGCRHAIIFPSVG